MLALPIQALTTPPPPQAGAKTSGVQAASATPENKAAEPQGVYVLRKDNQGKLRAHFVPVSTGITGSTDMEVVSGLKEGDEIVTGPYKTLRGLKENALLKRDTTLAGAPGPSKP